MRNVTLTVHVDINMTADDWQLYHIDGRDEAAIAINAEISELLNSGPSAWSCFDVYQILRKHYKYGAADSEGMDIADELVRLVLRS